MKKVLVASLLSVPLLSFGAEYTDNWGCYLNYISIIATLIGVCATIIVCYQIYNAMDVKQKLDKLEEQQKEINDKHAKAEEQIKKLNIISQESILLYNGFMILNNGKDVLKREHDAFLEFHHALLYSIDLNKPSYNEHFEWLEKCIEGLTYNSFTSNTPCNINNGEIERGVTEFMKYVDKDKCIILNNSNFMKIRELYMQMTEKLQNKLNEIRSVNQVK